MRNDSADIVGFATFAQFDGAGNGNWNNSIWQKWAMSSCKDPTFINDGSTAEMTIVALHAQRYLVWELTEIGIGAVNDAVLLKQRFERRKLKVFVEGVGRGDGQHRCQENNNEAIHVEIATDSDSARFGTIYLPKSLAVNLRSFWVVNED